MSNKTLQQHQNRLNYLDVCKAIGIILVVLGHTYGLPEVLYNIIYSFHMPLFFIVSGYLYNETKYNDISFNKLINLRFRAYVIPYISFGTINLITEILMSFILQKKILSVDVILNKLRGILLCYADVENMPNCSPIWFLMCLFISSLLFWAIIKYTKRYTPVFCIFCMCLSFCIYEFVDFKIPWSISTSFMATFFMYIGYSVKKYNIIYKAQKLKYFYLLLPICSILSIALGIINGGKIDMNQNEYGNPALFIVPSITLPVIIMFLCQKSVFSNNKFLVWLGNNTMPIIGFNYLIRDCITEIYYLIPYIGSIKLHWGISFILTLLGCFIFIFIYNKLKLAVLKHLINGKSGL